MENSTNKIQKTKDLETPNFNDARLFVNSLEKYKSYNLPFSFKEFINLKSLYVKNLNFVDKLLETKLFFENISKNPSIDQLTIDEISLDDEQCDFCAEYLNNKSLTALYLINSNIVPKGAEKICNALKNHPKINILTFNLTDPIKDEVTKHLADLLKNNQIINALSFQKSLINEKESQYLGDAIRFNSKLEALNLSNNNMGSKEVEYLINGLKCNKTLKYLFLSYNKLGKDAAKMLAEYFKECQNLKNIYLGNNRLDDESIDILFESLRFNRKLIHIDLGDNPFGDIGMIKIFEHISFTSLKYLNVFIVKNVP